MCVNASRPVDLREMTHADIDAGLRLCRLSHWNQVARDWRQFLDLTPGGAAVAVDDAGGVIGSVATMRYDAAHLAAETTFERNGSSPLGDDGGPLPPPNDSMAWIAMVLVDPVHRGCGIGTALLQHGLARAAEMTCAGLDATPLGQPLYERLGFQADAPLVRLQRVSTAAAWGGGGPDGDAAPPPDGIRPATAADLAAITTIDASVTGLDRRDMLAWLLEGAPGLAWVSEGTGGIDGALLGRPGHHAAQLGPIVAASEDVARALLGTCVAHHASTALFIDVADDRPGWREAVESLGFQVQRPFTRMYRGIARPATDTTRLFAIIGPEFG